MLETFYPPLYINLDCLTQTETCLVVFFFILEQSLTSGQLYLFILKSDTVWSWPVLSFGLPVSDSSMAAYQQFLKYIY